MPPDPLEQSHRRLAVGLFALAICAGLVWLAYRQAMAMTWQFDDYINLKDLAGASTGVGLVDFVLGGVAGPMGRPLSLVTFLVNYEDWTSNPWGVSRLNLLLHVLNAVLVYLLVHRLFARCSDSAIAPVWTAAAAAALWLMLPVHASSILMPVQRMTQVSAFFSLLTLFGFVAMRARWHGVPSVAGAIGLGLWLACGTLLSVLGKESGALTPALAALIELFFFERNSGGRARRPFWRLWLAAALLAVPVALAYHLATGWSAIQGSFLYYRGHNLAEHLATEAVISWEYMRQILLPRAALLGPYHDGHAVYSWHMWQPWVAVLAWGALLTAGAQLMRRGTPVAQRMGKGLLFAVLWFLACHQIESTLIPLELYFEHRNYIAALGWCWFIVYALGAFYLRCETRKTATLVTAVLVAVQGFALQQITSLWGQPMLANQMWAHYQPNSTRALQALSNDLLGIGFRDAALELSDEFVQKHGALDVAIQFFPHHCEGASAEEVRRRFGALAVMVPGVTMPGGIPTGLAAMGRAIRDDKCAGIGLEDYVGLLDAMLRQPSIGWSNRVRHHVEFEMALTQLDVGDLTAYADYARKAFRDFPSLSIAQGVALTLFEHGEIDQALAWVDDVLAHAPNLALSRTWTEELASLHRALMQVQPQMASE